MRGGRPNVRLSGTAMFSKPRTRGGSGGMRKKRPSGFSKPRTRGGRTHS